MLKNLYHIALIAIVLSLSSCSNQQFLMTKSTGAVTDLLAVQSEVEHVIQSDDKLSLSVWNHDDLSVGSVYSIYNSNESFGKWVLVDKAGFAQLPDVGNVKMAGRTCSEAADYLRTLYAEQINDPVIVVKVLNRKVTVLGEVRTPGSYVLEEEETSLVELLGAAQGMTNYANFKNVRLVRDSVSYTLNLSRMDQQLQQNILLQSGDLVIVSSKRGKTLDLKAPTLIPFASAITAIAIVLSLLN